MTYSKSLAQSAVFSAVFATLLVASVAISTISAGAVTNGTNQQVTSPVEQTENSRGSSNGQTFKIKSYETCLATAKKVTDTAKLKKLIASNVEKRVKQIDTKIAKSVAKLPEEQKAKLQAELVSDKAYLNKLNDAAATADLATLQTSYCQVKFYKLTRSNQVNALVNLNQAVKRDTRLQKALGSAALTKSAEKSAAKAELVQRLDQAKAKLTENIAMANADIKRLLPLNSSVNYNLLFTGANESLRTNFETAHRAYVEALVIRKAAGNFKTNKPVTVKSIELVKEDGSAIERGGKASRKATVVFQTSDGAQETVKLTRDAKDKPWTVVNGKQDSKKVEGKPNSSESGN